MKPMRFAIGAAIAAIGLVNFTSKAPATWGSIMLFIGIVWALSAFISSSKHHSRRNGSSSSMWFSYGDSSDGSGGGDCGGGD